MIGMVQNLLADNNVDLWMAKSMATEVGYRARISDE
jgi:hypothetical protein